MTKYVVDAPTLIRLARAAVMVAAEHELLAPTLARSQVLSLLHEAVHRGELPVEEAKATLAAVGAMKIRLLGDGVLRRNAWNYADQLGWASTFDAEYVALTKLQGDALITQDENLAKAAEGVVPTASVDDLC